MLMLSFEASAKSASVALCEDGRLISMAQQCSGLTHSRTLLPMAEDLLNNCDYDLKQIDLFSVSCGPGSFTGIRIGVSTVKGLAWAADKPCIGVSTLAAMAWNGVAAGGLISAVMDARRNEVYNALFMIQDGRPVRLCPDRAISLKELSSELKQMESVPFLVGDGAELAAQYLSSVSCPFRIAPENLRWQNAWGVAMEAGDQEPGSSQDLLPVYLRLSQAERERQARMKSETNQ